MNKLLIAIISLVILCCTESYSQSDSTWSNSVTARFSSDIISATGVPFRVTTLEGKAKKGLHTFVPMIIRKNIHSLNGYQFGMAYYKKWNWGYSHVDAFYSPSIIAPTFSFQSNVFFTLRQGLEANIGYNSVSYADGNKLSIFNVGATYYYKSLMSTYNVKMPVSGNAFQRLTVRKYLKSEKDHLQVSISSGLEQEGLPTIAAQPLNVYSFQFSIHKKIANKTQIQVSFGMTKSENESINNQFFNYGLGLKRDI